MPHFFDRRSLAQTGFSFDAGLRLPRRASNTVNGRSQSTKDNRGYSAMSKIFVRFLPQLFVIALAVNPICANAQAQDQKTRTGKEACSYLDNPPDLVDTEWELRPIEAQF